MHGVLKDFGMLWNDDFTAEREEKYYEYGGLIFMLESPTLKELLSNRKENHANLISVSTNKNKDLFKGSVS